MPVNETVLRERYKIIREISRGGMGVVYLARDLLSNQPVAVKKSFFSGDNAARRGFEAEAKLLARLKHEGLPKVLDYFILESNFQALVMDYIEGETLAEVLESGKQRQGRGLNSALVLNWALQILSILKYLHNFDPPVVHRDIKPNNIKVNAEGKIILLDFGLAKGSSVTIVGGMSGYSPIEQVNRTGTDPRSDIYALGTTLFHLLTDDYPLTALDRFRAVYGQSKRLAEPSGETAEQNAAVQRTVAEINPQVPPEISEVVMKAMALMPEDRFQNAEEMKSRLAFAIHNLGHEFGSVAQMSAGSVMYGEKNPSLFEDDEEIIKSLNVQNFEERSEDNSEKEIALNATVASASPISYYEQENQPVGFLQSGLSVEEKDSSVIEHVSQSVSPRTNGKKLWVALIGGGVIILLSCFGVLAWYLIVPNKMDMLGAETKTIAESTSSERNTTSKQIEISVFRLEKGGAETLLTENYTFQNNEKFLFKLKPPAAGFLYVISRDSGNKVVRLFPSAKETNRIQENKEIRFPSGNTLYFDNESPEISWIYFVVVPDRENDLAKKVTNTLIFEKEVNLSQPAVTDLMNELDAAVGNSATNIVGAENGNVVSILETRKKM